MGLERWRQRFGLLALVEKRQYNDQAPLLGFLPPVRTTMLSGTVPASPALPRQLVRREQAQPNRATGA